MPDESHPQWLTCQNPCGAGVDSEKPCAFGQTSHSVGDTKDNGFDMESDANGSGMDQELIAGKSLTDRGPQNQSTSLSGVDQWINSKNQPFNPLERLLPQTQDSGNLKRESEADDIDLDRDLKKRASEHSKKVVSDEAAPGKFDWPCSYVSPGLDGLFLTQNQTWSENDFHLDSPNIIPHQDDLIETSNQDGLTENVSGVVDSHHVHITEDAAQEHPVGADLEPQRSRSSLFGSSQRMACPWQQNDPQGHPDCAQGFTDWSKLREHIKRAHLIDRVPCSNCGLLAWIPIKGKKRKINASQECQHEQAYDRSRWVEKALHSIIFKKLDQEVKNRRRQHRPCTEEDKWIFIYLEFFPETDRNNVPSYVHISTSEHNVSAIEKELKASAKDLLAELEKILGKMTIQTRHEVHNAFHKCTKNVTAVFRGVKQASAAVSPHARRMSNATPVAMEVDIKGSPVEDGKALGHIENPEIGENRNNLDEDLSQSTGMSLPPPAWSYQETLLTPLTSAPSRARPVQEPAEMMYKHERF